MTRRGRKTKPSPMVLVKEPKLPKLSRQKQIKRGSLINALFMYASSFPQKITVSSLLQDHMRINDIITQLITIESELKIPLPNRNMDTIKELEIWAKKNGAEMKKVRIAEFDGYDFGLQAVGNVEEGDVVVSVPKKLMITIDGIKGSPMESIYKEDVVLQQLPNVALAIFILVERFKTDKPSFWLPYFLSLPSSYSTCVYFSLDDLNELKGSPALEYSLKMCKNIARQYAYFWSMFQKNTDETSNILRDVFTYEQYRWAVSTVMTRQNYIPCVDRNPVIPVNVIIPVWDFCNHANNKNKTDTEPSTTYSVETESCVCVAPKNFSEDEQINIFYGERSNADFLVHNGFVYPENYHDVVKVKFGISNSDSSVLRQTLLKKLKLPQSGEYLLKADKENPIHSSVLAFVRIFKMTEDQLQEWLNRNDAEDVLLGPLGLIGTQFDGEVLQYIQTRIGILLKAYPTTVPEDEKLLKEDLSQIRRLVIMHRMTEKKILQNTIDYCKLKTTELILQNTKIARVED